MTIPASHGSVESLLRARLRPEPLAWFEEAREEIGGGVDDERFCALLSTASRHARREPLAPTAEELVEAAEGLEGWCPERWTLLETMRVALVLARRDLAEPSAERAIEEAFRFADEGELCALYRSLAHLPSPHRFAWRGGEGCRTNMRTVFEATALDTPFPARVFHDLAWNQAVIKCVFVEAPLWRMFGLDARLSTELARMALDLADERRSAGRRVQHELWLALGPHAGVRGIASIERELAGSDTLGRRAAAYALARAGEVDRLRRWREKENDPDVAGAMDDALAGSTGQLAYRALDPRERA